MNNDQLFVEERSRDIGDFMVGRLLPFRKKRQVGPFTFIDHMGPATVQANKPVNVDQHPHIGLSTLTYLFKGEIEHRDSTGAVQIIREGDVGFMTSGSGVTHTERTPEQLRGKEYEMHGYQIWVALPKESEEVAPNFQFISAEKLPSKQIDGLRIKLISGEGFGMKSPLKVYSPQFMVDIESTEEKPLCIKDELKGEIAIVVVHGKVTVGDKEIEAGQMLISKTENECEVVLGANTTVLLFGGEPLAREHYLMWNFVSHSKERLNQAKEDRINRKFPSVPGDDTYIPFPKA